MELENRTFRLTGPTTGIGLEFVKQLAQQGANVIVASQNLEALIKTKNMFLKNQFVQYDTSKPKDTKHIYALLKQQFPKLSAIINNSEALRGIDTYDALWVWRIW